MAQQRAEKIITSNSRAEEVVLENLGLESLAPLVPLLAQMNRLKRLKLAKNNITSLPDDLSALRQVEFIDLSSNPIAGLNSVIRGLHCLTALKHLNIDLPFESDEDEIIVSLQSLESFNGTPLMEDADAAQQQQQQQQAGGGGARTSEREAPRQAWAPTSGSGARSSQQQPALAAKTKWEDSDMSQVQRLYQAVNSVSGRITNKNEFDEYTRSIISHLQTLVADEEDPFKREIEILKSKRLLFEYCFEEVARSAHRFDPNLSQVLTVVQESYNNLLENCERLSRNIAEDKERKIEVMKTDMQSAIQEIETLMHQMEVKGQAGDVGKFDAERRKLTEEIGWLRTENEKLQTRLRQSDLSRQVVAGGGSNLAAGTPGRATSSSAGGGGGGTFGAASDRSATQPSPTKVPAIGTKVLTQRQLHDAVEEIYASKSKYDIKCAETHLPRETMEQHMYTYLNQKYGLKHLILEWATAIIQGIKKYSAEDNDVAVFGKILRNELDEEFRFVQRQLKETVHELLRVYVKGKKPLKSDEEINGIVKKKVAGTLMEEEWVDIVKYMYNNDDAVSIIMRIRDILKQQAQPRRRRTTTTTRGQSSLSTNKEDEPQLTYNEFIRTLLDFQLEGHERFLSRFVRIFKQHDSDRNGIVNEHEFRAVLRAVDPQKSEEEVTALLDLIDPHNNQLITFSECVTFLSTELVRMMREEGTS